MKKWSILLLASLSIGSSSLASTKNPTTVFRIRYEGKPAEVAWEKCVTGVLASGITERTLMAGTLVMHPRHKRLFRRSYGPSLDFGVAFSGRTEADIGYAQDLSETLQHCFLGVEGSAHFGIASRISVNVHFYSHDPVFSARTSQRTFGPLEFGPLEFEGLASHHQSLAELNQILTLPAQEMFSGLIRALRLDPLSAKELREELKLLKSFSLSYNLSSAILEDGTVFPLRSYGGHGVSRDCRKFDVPEGFCSW